MGGNSTIIAMAERPEEFRHLKAAEHRVPGLEVAREAIAVASHRMVDDQQLAGNGRDEPCFQPTAVKRNLVETAATLITALGGPEMRRDQLVDAFRHLRFGQVADAGERRQPGPRHRRGERHRIGGGRGDAILLALDQQ
jgi:hypothetical protein